MNNECWGLKIMNKLLFALADKIRNCSKCKLRKDCNAPVPGIGNSKIMFVGEAPGAGEDKQGKPFVGRSGKLLDKMLKYMELDKSEVAITNVVKCRPLHNRTPGEVEINICGYWLDKEIKLLKPEIIVAMGRTAMRYFGIDMSVAKAINSSPFVRRKYSLFIIYHPAALLRNPQWRVKTAEVLDEAKATLRAMDL